MKETVKGPKNFVMIVYVFKINTILTVMGINQRKDKNNLDSLLNAAPVLGL